MSKKLANIHIESRLHNKNILRNCTDLGEDQQKSMKLKKDNLGHNGMT